MPPGTSTAAPDFDPARPFHLRSSSPCVDHGDLTLHPLDDIDGDLRLDGKSDCGADEYIP
jgi:hypothetical protein